VHVVPEVLNPVTVKSAVSEGTSVAVESVAATLPEVQLSAIVTTVDALSEKSFATWKLAVFSVFVIVHEPALSDAEHVPDDEYPPGIGDSVPVQVGSPV
jgi:hypothetical protein